ncbi:MAG: hypothetical protein JWO05_1492 [Gemmatimonadetes bacterium]|nr:hypothetical protein [Gemmatimonadota bacterium]
MRGGGIALVATMVASGVAQAQLTSLATERSNYVLLLGKDTLGLERVQRTPGHFEGELLVKVGGVRVRYDGDVSDNGLVTRVRLLTARTNTTDTSVYQAAEFRLVGDSVLADITPRGGSTVHQSRAIERGALPYLNPSAFFLELAVRRALMVGGDSVTFPSLQAAGGAVVPMTVLRLAKDSVRLLVGQGVMTIALSRDARLVGALESRQGFRIVAVDHEVSMTTERADYSAPAGAPYTSEEVVVTTPGGLHLSGTLTLPRVKAGVKVPAVLTLTGSGPEDRDEYIATVSGYRPFRTLADSLGRRGIAVLRLDDRGVGGSDAGPASFTTEDFAADAVAALEWLRHRPEVDARRLALLGHSEGGMTAPLAVLRDPRVRAMVLMAPPGMLGQKILDYQVRHPLELDTSLSVARRDSLIAAGNRSITESAAHNPWLRFLLDYDPGPTARKVRIPVLIAQGATDRQVTAEQAAMLARAFRAGGNRDVTVKIFPATNHLFLADPSGEGSGYAALPVHVMRPEVVGAVVDWLVKKLR